MPADWIKWKDFTGLHEYFRTHIFIYIFSSYGAFSSFKKKFYYLGITISTCQLNMLLCHKYPMFLYVMDDRYLNIWFHASFNSLAHEKLFSSSWPNYGDTEPQQGFKRAVNSDLTINWYSWKYLHQNNPPIFLQVISWLLTHFSQTFMGTMRDLSTWRNFKCQWEILVYKA